LGPKKVYTSMFLVTDKDCDIQTMKVLILSRAGNNYTIKAKKITKNWKDEIYEYEYGK
jgi:hypothetical protein